MILKPYPISLSTSKCCRFRAEHSSVPETNTSEATPKAALFIYILQPEATDHLFVRVYGVYVCAVIVGVGLQCFLSITRSPQRHKHKNILAIVVDVTVILSVFLVTL